MFVPEKCCTTSAWSFPQVTTCSFSQCVNTSSPCCYHQFLPVITNSPCLAPQPSNYWCLAHTHLPLIFWVSTSLLITLTPKCNQCDLIPMHKTVYNSCDENLETFKSKIWNFSLGTGGFRRFRHKGDRKKIACQTGGCKIKLNSFFLQQSFISLKLKYEFESTKSQ